MGIRRRYFYLAVVDVLVTFNFELRPGYYVDLVKTRYYNSFFLIQKVRMVTSILEGKLDELLEDISKPFAISSPSVFRVLRSPQYFCSTFWNREVSSKEDVNFRVTQRTFNTISFPKSVVCVTSKSVFKTVELFVSS